MELFIGLELFVLFLIVGFFILWVWALIDIITAKFREDFMQIVWLLAVFFLPFIGVLLYIAIGRSMKRAGDDPKEEQGQKYDHLAKIKALLDDGAITQEEFELEKRKILES